MFTAIRILKIPYEDDILTITVRLSLHDPVPNVNFTVLKIRIFLVTWIRIHRYFKIDQNQGKILIHFFRKILFLFVKKKCTYNCNDMFT